MAAISKMFWIFVFWVFVTIKVAGTSLAGWSWFWILVPLVPVAELLVRHFGL